MTVGITFTNGLEAVAITDSRISGGDRQSDSVNKMGNFSEKNYSGVIFGTGSANLIAGLIKNINGFSAKNLDEFVTLIQQNYKQKVDSKDVSYLSCTLIEIQKKAN